MKSTEQSARIRNYAIAGFFVVLIILSIASFTSVFVLWNVFRSAPVSIWSECSNESANVFIGANEDVRDVKCVALDKEFFDELEIVIGDLSKNDEDVCRFRLSRNTTEPLRFEVWYNDEAEREVCEWQHFPRFVAD